MSEGIEMDQDLAKRLLVEGGTFVFLGVPAGTEFGIDLKSWTVGEKFRGVKMIPPGLHFVYFNASNEHGDLAPRIGFMHNFEKKSFLVKKWDTELEDISTEDLTEEEVMRLKSNLLELDRYLGTYPFDVWNKWKKLTDKINENLVKKLIPECGKIRSALEQVFSNQPKKQKRLSRFTTEEDREEKLLPQLQPLPGTELRFTPFPDKCFPLGSSPAEITQHSLDKTYSLDSMLSTCVSPSDIIGELQFAFICFLVGLSLESFEHWKQLVSLFCSCDLAVKRRASLYQQFFEALEVQLEEVPEDFLVDIVSSNNIIYQSLRDLFRTIQESDRVDGRLQSKAERFKEKLSEKFLWDFTGLDKDDEDDAPVVVDL
ncbi:protein AAR2 homolog [Lycorma delicatula]|uniref:protein AAR2 homolog n=1 Tax=Lycorma delicatula TaxID=130591 RepID=UPI003F51834E